jgi:Icc protein
VSRGALTDVRVVQLSDCHVAGAPGALYRGLDAGRSLVRLAPVIRRWQPDLLLLTGDVSEDASAAAYGRVSALLDSIGAPVLALPGNHDDPAVMRRYFPRGPWGAPLLHGARGWQLVLLDSTAPGRIDGVLARSQLQGLKAGLQRSAADHVLVALHHQPVAIGSPWIDKYALDDSEWLLGLLDREARLRGVVFGHVHQAITLERRGVPLMGAPSSVANSLPGHEKFTLDIAGPACRWLRLRADGAIETGVLRPDPIKP